MIERPPAWATRFLAWYCNPELLEEIQGDIYELYADRLKTESKWRVNIKYVWDVLRFFRWSNIKRTRSQHDANPKDVWGLNFKIATRSATKKKLNLAIKAISLATCLSFSLLIFGYVIHKYTTDHFHKNHERIYRITSKVKFADHITHYAVTPLPIGKEFAGHIPEVESFFRFMHESKPVYEVDDQMYHDEITLSADSNFLKILSFDFIAGDVYSLDEPNTIVLTKSLSSKFFGTSDAVGQTIKYGSDIWLTVSAVIEDVPDNSHLTFDALVSWDTFAFDRDDSWGNLNAYNYILLKQGATIDQVYGRLPSLLKNFHEMITREYKATYEPVFQNINEIYFSGYMEEDIAKKDSKTNLLILTGVVFLFLLSGLVNFFNISMAESTANVRRITLLKVFGGETSGYRKAIIAERLLVLLWVVPITLIMMYISVIAGEQYYSIKIDAGTLLNLASVAILFAMLLTILLVSLSESIVISKVSVINALRGSFESKVAGISTRKILTSLQLAFSTLMIGLIWITADQFLFIQKSDKGFNNENIIVIKLRSSGLMNSDTFIKQLRNLNGIEYVDRSSYFPGVVETKYVFQLANENELREQLVTMMHCGHDYLTALNIELTSGRVFERTHPEDNYGSFIINETAAKEFGWQDPIGQTIKGPVGGDGGFNREGKVIGVVHDFNFASMHNKIEPLIIFLTDQAWGASFIYIKTHTHPSPNLIATLEDRFKSHWPDMPFEWDYLDSKYSGLYKQEEQMSSIFHSGLIISLLVSCLGIYSISALISSLRLKEMGIRKVVGASAFKLFLLQAKSFIQIAFTSCLIAMPMIWFTGEKWLQNFAYHISLNVWHFIIPGAIVSAIVVLISGHHSIKAALVNPVNILKHE